MRCPSCRYEHSRVIDSRFRDDKWLRFRRHECIRCAHRWRTLEGRPEELDPVVGPAVRGKRFGGLRTLLADALVEMEALCSVRAPQDPEPPAPE